MQPAAAGGQGTDKVDAIAAAKLRGLPQIQRLLDLPATQPLIAQYSHPRVSAALRQVLARLRAELLDAASNIEIPDTPALVARAAAELAGARQPGLRRVINATGIILHTNLGRAPLAAEVAAAVADIARGYCNLEFDLATGARGSRTHAIEALLRALTGAPAALAVNNNAAAMLLALSALAQGGEVVVSRGELVEIGGGFRIPDVIQQGGARLVEVGTTNKTRLADYRAAITPATRVLLKVHQSNFRIAGFTEATPLTALARLAHEHGLLLVHDLGSGALRDAARPARPGETTVADSLAAGTDVVAFSGDKLLGGPQSGLLVGRGAAIDPMRHHPLLRALRLDKLCLAALEATLLLYQDDRDGALPVPRAMAQSAESLRARAEHVAAQLGPIARIEASIGFAGGGALPGEGIASFAVSLNQPGISPEQLAARLRAHRPAVVGRIADARLLLDMLTIDDSDLAELVAAVREAVGPCAM